MATVVNIGDWVIASAHKIWKPEELAAAHDAVGLLEQAAERARQMIAQAEVDGEEIRRTAQSEGFRSGEVQALRQIMGRLGGQETLQKAVRRFLVDSVVACTSQLIASDLDPVRYRRMLETVERTLSGWSWITLRVSPESLDEASGVVASMQSSVTERITLAADDSLKPGECYIESDAGWLDGRIETQLDQVRAALTDSFDYAEVSVREP